MSISRREFTLALATACSFPSVATTLLNLTDEPTIKASKFTAMEELSKRLDGRSDFYHFRLAGPYASAHYRKKYEETFGHKVPCGFSPPDHNLIQMLRLAVEDNLPIREFMDGTIKSRKPRVVFKTRHPLRRRARTPNSGVPKLP